VQAARGVLSVVQTNMLGAIRIVSVRKGYDPRGYTMVAFGGAGPLHAGALARDLGIRQVLVPPAPGILCAMGLLVEPLRLDLVRTRVLPIERVAEPEVEALFADMAAEARAWLDAEGVPAARRRLVRAFDMRYAGQNFELTIAEPAASGAPRAEGVPAIGALRAAFFREHERVYGYAADDEPVQVVAFRLTALGEPEPLVPPRLARAASPAADEARAGERPVYFEELGDFTLTPIYRRERLRAGHRLAGPAVVEQMDATTVILPGQAAVVDDHGSLLVRTEA
jgi:N-methylhydantoinase A